MDHRISKDMISNGMTPSGQRSQQDLSRSQYGSAATPASLAEAYRKIHEMNKPPKPGVKLTPNAKPTPAVGRGSGGNTMQSASSAPIKNVESPAPGTSNTPKSDEPLATLNRAKKGDGYFGPTVSAGGYRMGIPNPVRKEEVEQVNEGEKPMGQHPGKSPDKATRDRYETQSRRATAPTGVGVPDKSVGYGQLKQSADLFDIVKGHFIDEGLTEEEALKKMITLTDEERSEIIEGSCGSKKDKKKKGGY